MAIMKTSNPAFGTNTFSDVARSQFGANLIDSSARMTLDGTINKTGVLLLCCVATAAWTWNSFLRSHNPGVALGPLVIGGIGGFIIALVTVFKKEWAPVTAPIYALLEGLVLGGISAVLNARFSGIAIEAVSLTFGTLFVMLLLYKSGVIKVTHSFRVGVIAATGGIAVFYLVEIGLGFFGIKFTTVNGPGPIGIAFGLFVVAIAALNLVLDFDFVAQGVIYGVPKYMEWYAAFGIMVTLVWLYLEILNLLSKMRSSQN